ncbi:DDT domain-containing protein PTM [Neltuma alba]|uniref:DDT domain-containing protein PTM n=1 Tax=Neltuma alba TaxID=207710 RepID=UPI0010A36421|nr:DDT domain-containing protein PTM-like [Prosopis alba]
MEAPVIRSRGRPRKRRKEDENGTDGGRLVPDLKRQAVGTRRPIELVGRYIIKEFKGSGVYLGKVVYYECGLYRVNYEDGDYEDLDSSEIRGMLLNDCDLDDELTKRRNELDQLVLKYSAKKTDGTGSSSADLNKDVTGLEAPASSELPGGLLIEHDEVDVEEDAHSSSDERDSTSDAEIPSLPPPLQLPPSSGTIGVPEPYVSHLLAVYGFLRSFSIRLFLSPFSLDDFVGSLNCQVSNTLFDSIHVSLMRALRRHLEALSSEGSEHASKCLRCNDWGLIDALTWPVFVIQYLAIYGYTRGPGWKGFYEETFNGEYYLLPVSRKLTILQILCDDVLESEEMKTEMGIREELEVGMEYDAQDTLPEENWPRFHPRNAKNACKDKEATKFVLESNAVKPLGNSLLDFRDTRRTEDADVDRNGDECRLCGMDGTLLCCDGCPSAYHSRCIGVMKMFIPEGPWYCPECKINMNGLSIARGTSLRGAELFGMDLYGQLFMGTCDHLLVLTVNSELCLRYYNQNDILKVLQLLYASVDHRPLYYGICMAVLHYWNIPESFLHVSVGSGTDANNSSTEEDAKSSSLSTTPLGEKEYTAIKSVKTEYPATSGIVSHGDYMVRSNSLVTTTREACAFESSNDIRTREYFTMNTMFHKETRMEPVISDGPGGHQRSHFDMTNSHGHASDKQLPFAPSLQFKEGNQASSGKVEHNSTKDFSYMGFSFKPQSYVNHYMHGDFAASAAAKLAILSSEDSRSEGHVIDNLRKFTAEGASLQAKAFSMTVSRFFWPSSEKKPVEVPRERCGWCLSCKASASSKRGCMLNHAALSATKSAIKVLSGLSAVRSGEGILPSIATYVMYLEESLHGLIVGPFLNGNYRKQWRKRVEQARTFKAIKPLLLELEENIRIISFTGDWVKLMDDWLVESSIIQGAANSVGTIQTRATSGRRLRKQSATDEVAADVSHERNFDWWYGGKSMKILFLKAVLPNNVVRKAARQGGLEKISGISYADGCEIPKRSRQMVWRAAVQMSRNASQLALQVRYLDFNLRWSDLICPEQNLQDGKGQETESSAFRNANICDKKELGGKLLYGVVFRNQKHLPSRIMKNIVEVEQGQEGKEKYWFSEARVPLYLVKEYEAGIGKMPSHQENLKLESQLRRRRLKAACKDIFLYLTCKRDNWDIFSCAVCQMDVLAGNALKCNACQGYCHEGCSISSTFPTNKEVEFLTTCKRCYAKLLAQRRTSDESPTSPLLLQGQEHSSVTVLKGSRPKCYDQALKSTSIKDSYPDTKQGTPDSALAAKSRRRNSSWGIIWNKKSGEDTGIDFRLKNILLKGGSGAPQLQPVCHLCRKPYRSDLMYVRCETCKNWYHADALELEESKIFEVLGFKCCKCRRIKSPECPYSDKKPKMQEGTKKHRRPSKKDNSSTDNFGVILEPKECEPATPNFPVGDDGLRQDNDPLLYSLSSANLITDPNAEVDVERSAVSGLGLRKLPVRRHVKHEGDGDESFGTRLSQVEILTQNGTGGLSAAEKASSPVEYDPAVCLDSSLLNDCGSENYEFMDFEPHTYFSVTELLQPDDNQFEGADGSENFSGYLENVSTTNMDGIPEESGALGLVNKSEPAAYLPGSGYHCCQCMRMEPVPDLSCEICGLWIHSQCSPWIGSPSRLGSWRCGSCREWQ